MNNNELPKRSLKQKIFSFLLVAIIIFIGVSYSKYLLKTKPRAKKSPPGKSEIVVKTINPLKKDSIVKVSALGTIIPSKVIALTPQVSGIITYINPNLVPGGLLKKGEIAAKIDKSDYLILRDLKKNNLEKAKADMEIEYGRQKVAKKEWNLLQQYLDNVDNDSAYLALRKPQLKQKLAAVKNAEQELKQAQLNLKRTDVKIPFDCIVEEKKLNIGSFANIQTAIAQLIGVNAFWIRVSIPVKYLSFLNLDFSKEEFENNVFIFRLNDNKSGFIKGKIIKILPNVDSKGKMAGLLIEVNDPLNLKKQKKEFPLFIGDTVKIVMEGIRLKNVYEVPSELIYNSENVLIAKNGKLKIAPVSIVWRDFDNVYINKGLNDNDSVIVTNISAPVEGMRIKVIK
jgi:RND family efflux transporter MFP subunit